MIRHFIASFAALILLAPGASSQQPAELLRVVDGVFSLKLNETVDLTDQALLLAVTTDRDCLAISVGGRKDCIEIGERYDLTYQHGPFQLGDMMADKQRCFLDIVGIDEAKGEQPNVTFRLLCA